MKKIIIILGVVFVGLSMLVHLYLTQYYCVDDYYCTYRLVKGISINIIYLSVVFLLTSITSLIGGKSRAWLCVFGIMSFLTLFTDYPCSVIGCLSREIWIFTTCIVTISVGLITNLISRFRK